VEDKTQRTLFRSLVNTFIYFDGVPREIQSDNQKACVDRWELGRPVFNKQMLEFATFYRFRPMAIHPGKPQENLKIERPFFYLEMNFLNARKFYTLTGVRGKGRWRGLCRNKAVCRPYPGSSMIPLAWSTGW
jgi:transposase